MVRDVLGGDKLNSPFLSAKAMAASLLSKFMLPVVCPARESELEVHPMRGFTHRSFFSKLSFHG
jgi:hypothetical protein